MSHGKEGHIEISFQFNDGSGRRVWIKEDASEQSLDVSLETLKREILKAQAEHVQPA